MNTSAINKEEIEAFFLELSIANNNVHQSYEYILKTIDSALLEQNLGALLALIPYMEKGQGNLAFQYLGKLHRILRILHLIEIEIKYQKPLFSHGCIDSKALLDKYMAIVFALRRLSFRLSEDSINEAVSFLYSLPISYFSVHTLIEAESIYADDFFYELLLYVYHSQWSDEDINNFFALRKFN